MALVVLPIGLHPLGTGAPPTYDAVAPPPVIGAEQISQLTKDVASASKAADPIDAQIQGALNRLRGSGAAVTRDGQRFLDVRKLDDSAKTLLEREARTALGRLVTRGDVTIDDVRVVIDSGGQWAEVYIDLFNNRLPNSKKQTVKVPIRPEAKGS